MNKMNIMNIMNKMKKIIKNNENNKKTKNKINSKSLILKGFLKEEKVYYYDFNDYFIEV